MTTPSEKATAARELSGPECTALKARTVSWLRIPKRDWTTEEKALIDLGLIETAVIDGIPSWRLTYAGCEAKRALLSHLQGGTGDE